jgi:hypothetical protein
MATTITTNPLLDDKIVLQYPASLPFDDEYVMFRINTDSKSTALREDKKSEADVLVSSRRQGTGVTPAEISKLTPNTDPSLTTRFGKEAVEKTTYLRQKGMKSLNKVIVLPMPNDHNVRTTIQYNDEHDPSFLTKMMDSIATAPSTALDLATLAKNKGMSIAANKVMAIKKYLIGGGDSTSVNQMLAEDRYTMNPKKEVMFKDFNFRSFTMTYTFAPKSQTEANMVKSIIETFRYYALPEISQGKLFYIFPSEFEILFLKGSKDNPNIPRITTSVLRSINVNYTPMGLWSSLPDGSSVSMVMTLDFQELELVDRGRVWNKEPVLSGF